MFPYRSMKLLTVLAFLMIVAFGTRAVPPVSAAGKAELTFVHHGDIGAAEQDVYIERNDIPADEVMRVKPADTKDPSNLAKMLYGTAAPHMPDPFALGANPFGPFKKGVALGFTLQEWLASTGSGTYAVEGDNAELHFSFQHLRPKALYTLWCVRVTPPPSPNAGLGPPVACGAPDGSQNAFTTDAQGHGVIDMKMKALLPTTQETASSIAVEYHADGKNYGGDPGPAGQLAHVQLLTNIPPLNPPIVPPTTGGSLDTTLPTVALMIGLFLVIGGWGLWKRLQTR